MTGLETLTAILAAKYPRIKLIRYSYAGDFVDRGAWGLEVLLVFLVWKLAFPSSVFLLRGECLQIQTFYFCTETALSAHLPICITCFQCSASGPCRHYKTSSDLLLAGKL